MRHTVDDKYWQWFTSQQITTFLQYWHKLKDGHLYLTMLRFANTVFPLIT